MSFAVLLHCLCGRVPCHCTSFSGRDSDLRLLYLLLLHGFTLWLHYDTSLENDRGQNLLATMCTTSRVHRVALNSLHSLRFRFGFMKCFDKDLYIFGAVTITDAVVNVLLL